MIAATTLLAQAAAVVVGAGGFESITAALAAARAGDTVRVTAGNYHEHLMIDRAVTLLGEPGAVIDGDGRGVVLYVTAPAVISGFTIRGSGANQAREDAGILAERSGGLRVEHNTFEDVLFGVYVKQSDSVIIRGNTIGGKNVAIPLRGDGIRLWYSHNGSIEDNVVQRTRDVVIWFSNGTRVRRNMVRDGRYGLHYMYSNRNSFEENQFIGNHVGAFIMYSSDIHFRGNLFADARGTTGRGLGFKDSENIVAEQNVLVKNAVGISIDNSPHTQGVHNQFRDNLIAYNDVAVVMLPSVHSNIFLGNDFVDNMRPVTVSGGGTALANDWRGNYWSEYAGFDADDDGHGDSPFVYERLSDDLLARHDDLLMLNLSPALELVNTLTRVLPFLTPKPVIIDSFPRLTISDARRISTAAPSSRHTAAFGFLLVCAAAVTLMTRLRRPFRRLG